MKASSGMWMLLLAVTLLLPAASTSDLKKLVATKILTKGSALFYPDQNTLPVVCKEQKTAMELYRQNNYPLTIYLEERVKRNQKVMGWLEKINYDPVVVGQLFVPQVLEWNWQNRQFLHNMYGGPWASIPQNERMMDLKALDSTYAANKMFTEEWFRDPKVLEVLKHNIKVMDIKSEKSLLADTNFCQELLDLAGSGLGVEQKTIKIYVLLIKYKLEYAVKPENPGKECLWSGHVENSNFAQAEEMTPLETPVLMQALSKTFGTENFRKGVAGDGFKTRWTPNVGPIFNAATIIYCSDMNPEGGTLQVYTNQLKSSSAFFGLELDQFVSAGRVKKIKFIVLSPPPTVAKLMVVEVSVVTGDTAATRLAVRAAFSKLASNEVKKLYENRFSIFIPIFGQESHPFDSGTRKESTHLSGDTYRSFFKNSDLLPKKRVMLPKKRVNLKVAAFSGPDKFDFYLLGTSALFLIVIAYHILKNIMTRKTELNIVFNMESTSGQHTEFEVI